MKKIITLAIIIPLNLLAFSNAATMNNFFKEKEEKIMEKSNEKVSKKVECEVYEKLNKESLKKMLDLEKKRET